MSRFKWLRKSIEFPLPHNKTLVRTQQRNELSDEQSKAQAEIGSDIGSRIAYLRRRFSESSDVVYHTLITPSGLSCALIYIKGMIDQLTVEQSVLKALAEIDPGMKDEELYAMLFASKQLPIAKQTICDSMTDAERSILDGNPVLMADGEPRMLSLSISSTKQRSIDEPPNESVIRGPREAFIEDLETNITLIRKRLKTHRFTVESMHFGKETHTAVALVYLTGVCKQELVDEAKKRLSSIEIDGVLGSSYLEEYIEDNPYSPFPQLQNTERPDVACAALLEGRFALIVDGTPIIILAPVTLFMLMQSAEDYYQRYIAASWIRLIRYFFLLISILLPSFYIAITTFHPDIIPERLLVTVAAARESVPFPALLEAFIMELSFEALREASLRIPKVIGQAVSIIGALIIGTAAVQAGIVSASMVIVVSMTGIASFIIPHYDLGLAFRLIRFPIMLLAGLFGLFGIACGMILLYFHLIELRSFGLPYLEPLTPRNKSDLKDGFVRSPWWVMKSNPSFSGANKQRSGGRKWAAGNEEEE
ncbi:spore germination protein [Paenibacillus sp. OV219]|uniref:spore germination protein n=1 Tax=Paenibacillus sp. OV219 TaxID=1884377 RepID=UPI0008B1EB39|nr:spore germination protein [Paenibacillus sp. OV219]SEP16516.1 spore germination protein KA/spore germination protein [Paenibacillus sp. OV219]